MGDQFFKTIILEGRWVNATNVVNRWNVLISLFFFSNEGCVKKWNIRKDEINNSVHETTEILSRLISDQKV